MYFVINDMCCSPDGTHIFLAGDGSELSYYNIADECIDIKMEGHNNEINFVAITSDHKFIVSSSESETILWNPLNA